MMGVVNAATCLQAAARVYHGVQGRVQDGCRPSPYWANEGLIFRIACCGESMKV